MQTILGSTGTIGTFLAQELYTNYTHDIRLVSRKPVKVNDTDELVVADLTDKKQTLAAIAGSEVVYLVVGLPNNTRTWVDTWPVIMDNVLSACAQTHSKLVFLDNTYMYGKSSDAYSEKSQFAPCGPKARVRAKISMMVMNAISQHNVEALIGRAPEFYGPGRTIGITNSLLFHRLRKHQHPQILINDRVQRTLIYTPDAARALALLGNTPEAYNQVWHLPCPSQPISMKRFVSITEEILGTPISYSIKSCRSVVFDSLRNKNYKELLELLYRYKHNWIFDSSKFRNHFPQFSVTSYHDGIQATVQDLIKNSPSV